MAQINIQRILDSIKQVSMSPYSLETICEFERVLDENGIYAFENWKGGELVEGPVISTYRVECTFWWPLKNMPDPAGAARLSDYGVKTTYRRGWLIYPIEVKSEGDYRASIKKPKLARQRIWLVTINIPKYLIKDVKMGSEEMMRQEYEQSQKNDQ